MGDLQRTPVRVKVETQADRIRLDRAALTDGAITFANSTLINSARYRDLTMPQNPSGLHEVSILNPSTVTDLEMHIYNLMDVNGIYASPVEIGTGFTVVKATTAVLEDCEDAWNEDTVANVTSAADSSDKKVGSNSQKFTMAAAFTTGIIGYESMAATDLSARTHLRLWIKSDKATSAGDIQLLLDNTAKCASPTETLDIPALAADTWTQVFLALENPGSDTAIISIGMKLNKDSGAQNIWIDDVNAMTIRGRCLLVEGMFAGGSDVRVKAINLTALGAAEGFDAYVQIAEV